MKRNLLYLFGLTFLFMLGCSKEEITPNGEDDGNGEANTSYLAVNLVSTDISGTLTRSKGNYEDGTGVENKVDNVRFYFFNGTGGAVNVKVKEGSRVNYYDWKPKKGEQMSGTVDTDDIESKLNAIIVINTAAGDAVPQRIAAVLNPPTINGTSLLGSSSLNLSQLQDKVADFATTGENGLTSEGKFVMFNAVYAKENAQVSTVAIKNENLCTTEDLAKESPVTIYVERNVAKVRVTLDTGLGFSESNDKIALKDKDGNNLTINNENKEEQVYLKLDKWGLSAETSEGRLVKKINPKWAGTWWNDNYRSYWAINSMTASNKYHTFNNIGGTFGKNNALYTNENAQLTDDNGTQGQAKNHTKVILKGQLCKADGTALTIVRHLGVKFVDDANLTKLKESILSQLAASGYTYYFGDATTKTQIGTDDLQIVVADQKETESSVNNCYVYAQLTETAAAKTWYTSKAEDAQPLENAATTINNNLKDKKVVDWALVWKDGKTYYFYEIKHLPDDEGTTQAGVVRNHIYETNVKKIAGLGTPVYDPDKVIYPEKPDPNDHYIAAEIKILSWRIVSDAYELEW